MLTMRNMIGMSWISSSPQTFSNHYNVSFLVWLSTYKLSAHYSAFNLLNEFTYITSIERSSLCYFFFIIFYFIRQHSPSKLFLYIKSLNKRIKKVRRNQNISKFYGRICDLTHPKRKVFNVDCQDVSQYSIPQKKQRDNLFYQNARAKLWRFTWLICWLIIKRIITM